MSSFSAGSWSSGSKCKSTRWWVDRVVGGEVGGAVDGEVDREVGGVVGRVVGRVAGGEDGGVKTSSAAEGSAQRKRRKVSCHILSLTLPACD